MAKKNRTPGQIAQIWEVYKVTARVNPMVTVWTLLSFLAPVIIGVVIALFFAGSNVISWVLAIVLATLVGVLLALVVMGRIAERTAYRQMEGRPGASGAVLSGSLRRGWMTSEQPIAVNPKTMDAIFRAVGRAGVVLVAEGPRTRTQRLVDEERRKSQRLLPNVPVTVLTIGPDPESIPLAKLAKSVKSLKRVLTRAEVLAVGRRMSSLGHDLPIPKGIDPQRIRSTGRPR